MMTVAETIRKISRDHLLDHKGLLFGQCLTAVGWIAGTVPELTENDGLVEAPMADVAWPAFTVGAALAGRRPIMVVRYQGFQWFNAAFIVNYAAKSKEMWGIPCPVFVRSIAMDGSIGPVAGGSHHSIFTRMPGIAVTAPVTPGEYQQAWDHFMSHDDPMYVSEHRATYQVDYEMENVIHPHADITLFPISSTRLNAIDAAAKLGKEGITCNIIHLLWLKPFVVTPDMARALGNSRHGGIVIDGDFENGAAKCIAFDMMQSTGKKMHVLGLDERTAGFAPHLDNLPPTAKKIDEYVKKVMGITS